MRKLWEQLAIATNWPVLVAVAILSAVGVLSIWVTDTTDTQAGKKQLIFLGVGIVCMTLFQAVNYQTIGRWAWPFYAFSMMLVAYTLAGAKIAGLPFVHETKGVYAWINFGPVSVEPGELMKLAFVLVLARYLRFRSNYRTMRGLLAPFAVAFVPLAMILKQPDMGMASLFVPTLFAMLFVAGARIKHLVLVALMGLAMIPIMWFSGPKPEGPGIPVLKHMPVFVKAYQRQRVFAMFKHDPRTMRESAYQTQRAVTAFASGGITGKGAAVIPVGKYVPEAHNDMIFALVGEQFGFVGAAVVLGASHGAVRGGNRDRCRDARAIWPVDRGGRCVGSGDADFCEPDGHASPDAGHGNHTAVRQLWGEQFGEQLHGGRTAAQCRAEPAACDGAGSV